MYSEKMYYSWYKGYNLLSEVNYKHHQSLITARKSLAGSEPYGYFYQVSQVMFSIFLLPAQQLCVYLFVVVWVKYVTNISNGLWQRSRTHQNYIWSMPVGGYSSDSSDLVRTYSGSYFSTSINSLKCFSSGFWMFFPPYFCWHCWISCCFLVTTKNFDA